MCVDAVVTGNPLYSLTATAGLAQELERTQGFSSVVASLWTFGVRIDKLPVILGAIVGLPLAIWLAPRRVATPLAALALLVFVFLAEGAAGASVVDRYLMGAATVLLLFCAVALGGWSMLVPGSTAAPHMDGRAPVRSSSTAAYRRPPRSASRACARPWPTTRTSTRASRSRWPTRACRRR